MMGEREREKIVKSSKNHIQDIRTYWISNEKKKETKGRKN